MTMKILLVYTIQILSGLFVTTEACTEFRVEAEDRSVVVGRSMEFMLSLRSYIVAEPKGHLHWASLPLNCILRARPLKWRNKYPVAYLNAWGVNVAVDGMNTAGLSVGALFLLGFTQYQKVPTSKCGNVLSHLELPLWLLTNFATVQEIRETINSGKFPLVFPKNILGLSRFVELHYSVTDKSGDAIVIEYTKDGRKVFNNTVGIVTNSPPYDFMMLNLRNYVQLSNFNHEPLKLGRNMFPPTGQGSGLLGLPGDVTPPSRFIRAAVLNHFADPVKTNIEAVNLAFHVLNAVDIPRGVAKKNRLVRLSDYSSWVVARDLTNNALYFRDYNDLTIRVVYLNDIHSGQVLKLKVESPTIQGFKNVTAQLHPILLRTPQ